MPTAPLRIIDLSAPGLDGLLESLTSNIYQVTGERFMRNQSARRRWQFVQPSTVEGEIFDLQDLTGAEVEVVLGQPDVAPTGGTFSGSYDGDSLGLTALAWNISQGALQTALNGNPSIAAAGGVTVTTSGALYVITFVVDGARERLLWDTESIVPPSSPSTAETQEGDSDTPSIQTLLISQQPYAEVTMSEGDIEEFTASGTLIINRHSLLAAFAATTADTISAQEQIKITWPGEEPDVVYRGSVLIHRDFQGISNLRALPPSPYPRPARLLLTLPEITSLTGGGADALDGIDLGAGLYVEGLLAALNVDGEPLFWRVRQNTIIAISSASPGVVTTSKPHGLVNGQTVAIGGTDSTPTLDGDRVVTVLSDTEFSAGVNTSVAGGAGFATPAEDTPPAGLVRPDNFDAEDNPLYWQSRL